MGEREHGFIGSESDQRTEVPIREIEIFLDSVQGAGYMDFIRGLYRWDPKGEKIEALKGRLSVEDESEKFSLEERAEMMRAIDVFKRYIVANGSGDIEPDFRFIEKHFTPEARRREEKRERMLLKGTVAGVAVTAAFVPVMKQIAEHQYNERERHYRKWEDEEKKLTLEQLIAQLNQGKTFEELGDKGFLWQGYNNLEKFAKGAFEKKRGVLMDEYEQELSGVLDSLREESPAGLDDFLVEFFKNSHRLDNHYYQNAISYEPRISSIRAKYADEAKKLNEEEKNFLKGLKQAYINAGGEEAVDDKGKNSDEDVEEKERMRYALECKDVVDRDVVLLKDAYEKVALEALRPFLEERARQNKELEKEYSIRKRELKKQKDQAVSELKNREKMLFEGISSKISNPGEMPGLLEYLKTYYLQESSSSFSGNDFEDHEAFLAKKQKEIEKIRKSSPAVAELLSELEEAEKLFSENHELGLREIEADFSPKSEGLDDWLRQEQERIDTSYETGRLLCENKIAGPLSLYRGAFFLRYIALIQNGTIDPRKLEGVDMNSMFESSKRF